MKLFTSIILTLCCAAFVLAAPKKGSRPIRTGDIYRATSVYLQRDQTVAFANKVMAPIYRATEIVMIRQMPMADKLAAEIAQSLSMIFKNDKELAYIAARAFMNRPDLFHSSFDSPNTDDRAKAVAKIFVGWVSVKADMEMNPQITTSTKVRMGAFNNIINSWKNRYPKYLPQQYKQGI